MSIKIRQNLVSGLFFFLLSLFLLFSVQSQIKTMETGTLNARTFPYLISAVLMLASVKLIVTDLDERFRKKKRILLKLDIKTELKALLIFGILIIWLALMPFLGYLISSILMVSAFLVYFRVKIWWYYLVMIASCFLIHYVFTAFLNVQLV
jgi:putative tricarboxylic transport membrane protein